ncbi:MAG TPA: anthranilate synthase component I [Egibacteraceae bacterium]|nr:anthranilate synthase component I [Egibacteraceae bacterium]
MTVQDVAVRGAAPYRPTREEFTALAARHAVVPVWREVLADLQTPLAVYDRLRTAGGPTFLLESVEKGERWGRYSFIGLRPFLTMSAQGGQVRLEGAAPAAARDAAAGGDPLATLEALAAALRAPQLPGLPPLFAGAVGYLGYDIVRFVERLPDTTADDLALDDVRLVFPGQLIAFDHLRQRLHVVSNVLVGRDPGRQYDEALTASEDLVDALSAPVRAPPVAPPQATKVTDAAANMTREAYLAAVEVAKEYIRAGDVFQVVPSQRFSLDTDVDPFSVYRVLRVINPSPYLYLFDYGDLQIVGSSPEALVKVEAGEASIWPIAGSRPRGATDAEDEDLERSLLADEKERAEHVMLVDLARNDLGRVCEVGTVRVAAFMEVVRYSHVMHLSSRVTGRVRPDVAPVGVLRATFPAGTLTGAPKVRAMEIIDELETTRRGVYGGGIGYLDLAGNLDLCIAIRTLVFAGGRAHVQAGAGVVADSVAEREYAETQDKAMALLAAVRAAEGLTAARAGPDRGPRSAPGTVGP